MNSFEKQLLKATPTRQTKIDGVEIRYIPAMVMGYYFGYALQSKAFILEGLPQRVERFVIAHEMYHLQDTRKWLGWFGSEGRANISCGIRDPIGLLSTIVTSIKKGRLSLYWQMIRTGGQKPS